MWTHKLPLKGHSPQFSAHVYIMANRLHALGYHEVGLSLGDIVLDGNPAPELPHPERGTAPNFRPMSVVVKRLDGLRCRLVIRPGDFVFDGLETQLHPEKNGRTPHPIFAHVYCGQTAGWIKMALGTEVNLGPGDVLLDGVGAPP